MAKNKKTFRKKVIDKFDSKLSNKEAFEYLYFLVLLNRLWNYEKEIILLEKVMKILNYVLKIIFYYLENSDF